MDRDGLYLRLWGISGIYSPGRVLGLSPARSELLTHHDPFYLPVLVGYIFPGRGKLWSR